MLKKALNWYLMHTFGFLIQRDSKTSWMHDQVFFVQQLNKISYWKNTNNYIHYMSNILFLCAQKI